MGATPTDSSPHSASLLPEGHPLNDNRSSQAPPEGGNICGANNMHQGFSFQNISGSQKRRFTKTSNKPTPAEPICSLGTFQDGEHPLSGELNPGGGLDDKNGSERCLLLHPNPPRTSSMATLPVATTSVPVSMSPLWPVLSTSGVHQSDTVHSGMVETTGNKNGCIHRRLPAAGTHQGGSSPPSPINGDNISSPGIFNKHREIPPNSTTGDRVLGSYDSVTPSSISSATTQAANYQGQSYATSTQRCSQSDHKGQGDCTIHWNCQCCSSGNTTSSLVLQVPPGNQASLSKSREGTEQPNTLVDHRQGRAKLVERTSQSMEFSQFDISSQSAQDNHRRIQLGMGGSLQRGDYWGTLVPNGKNLPHQLPGDVGSLSSSSVLYKGSPSSPDCLSTYGQHHSNLPSEPQRWDSLPLTLQVGQTNLGVVHVPKHLLSGQSPTWTSQLDSRPGVQDGTGQMGLATSSRYLSQDQPEMGTTCSRPVCIQANKPATSILQLEARPSSLSLGCIPSGLVREDLLCKPPMGPNVESPVRGQSPTSRCTDSGSSLERTAMVSSSTVPTVRPSSPDPPHNMSHTGSRVDATTLSTPRSTAGRMAHLRGYCQAEKVSEQASELLMASWRQKSNKSYNSLFHKWECWCVQRDRNPISGPVADISNFLAELYHDGYSYSSLNSYRSAISSIHEHIEGHPVGQHPQVTRILKGAYNLRPPTPRYSSTWKVSTVVTWLDSIELSNEKLPLIELSIKTVLLLSLTRPLRSADLANFLLPNLKYLPEGALFMPACPSKQSRIGKPLKEFFFPAFEVNPNLCPANAIKIYSKRTECIRKSESLFFLTTVPDHHPATASTVARWIKTGLSRAGIDISIFKAHSVRSASTSAAAHAGVTVPEIMEAADWSSASVFEKFYYRPHRSVRFGQSVISSASNLQS